MDENIHTVIITFGIVYPWNSTSHNALCGMPDGAMSEYRCISDMAAMVKGRL